MNVDVQRLVDQFRLEVDDLQPEGSTDESDRLFTTSEIIHYLDQAQKEFVRRTLYLHNTVRIPVPPEQEQIRLSQKLIKLDRIEPYLETQQTPLCVINANELAPLGDDYGQFINTQPWRRLEPGRPRAISFDFDEDYARLFPASAVEDTLVVQAYIAAPTINVEGTSKLVVQNEEHMFMLLPGMKYRAYRKQDADSYDPNQARDFKADFDALIADVYSERQRRRRKPGIVCYGGL